MKKYLLKTIFLLITIIAFNACDKDELEKENLYSGDPFISFGGNTSGTVLEGATEPIAITALASITNLTANVTVNFTLSTDANSADFTVVDNKTSFTFGPDNYSDELLIMPVNNNDEDGNKQINITLTSTSGAYTLGFPGPDANSKSFDLTIVDDDCLFTLQELGDAVWTGSDNAPANEQGPNASLITTSYDGTDFFFEGIAYGWLIDPDFWNEPVVTSNMVKAEIDPITGVITIAEQPLCETTYLGDLQAPYRIVATGQYLSCSESLTLNYDLLQEDPPGSDTYPVLRSFSETITK